MTLRLNAPRAGVHGMLLCAALLGAPMLAHAHHVGDTLTTDQQLVSASNQFLAALSQWEKLPPSLKASNLAGLVQLAQTRQQLMISLVQLDAKVAAARMLPKPLRARMPDQAAAYVETEVHVQGSSFINVSDNFANGISHATFKIVGNPGGTSQNVYLADPTGSERDLHKLAGKKLTFDAMRVGDYLVLLDKKKVQVQDLQAAGGTTSSAGTPQAAGAAVQGDQKTLSILVNFTDSTLTPSCTATDVASRLFGASGATVNNNYKESSRGLVSFSGTAVGPFTINYASTGTCDYLGWGAAAEAAAKAAGVDLSLYSRVNYVTPSNSSCGWSGLAYMPGRQSWVQSCTVTGVFSHELGHNISLHHAATPTYEYGDNSDPMGGAQLVDHNGANRTMAGWMPSGSVLDVASSGSYSLATISSNSAAASPQVLRMAKADTSESYYISMREPMNLDASLATVYRDTISVHRATGTLPTKTYLLQNLAAGQSYTDSVNGITIANQGTLNGTATVGITTAAPACVRNAPAVSVSPASQTSGPGATLTYTVGVTNQNTSACASSTFNLAQTLPTGFSGSFGAPSLLIVPGATATSSWSVASGTTLADATYSLTAIATDASSGTSNSAHASDIIYGGSACTASAPTVTVSPSSQSGAAGATLPYTVTVTNRNSSGCGNSTFSLGQTLPSGFGGNFNAASLTVAAGGSASSTWSVASGATASAGTYGLSAKATDSTAGTSSSVNANGVIVVPDTTPPALVIGSPAAGGIVSGRNVTISATATDSSSGIQAVEFYVDGTLLARDTSTPYTANWNLRKASKTTHTIKVRAIDNAGNAAEQSIIVTVQ
jgi:hypothetical protein